MAQFVPLFWAKIKNGIVDYRSCRTGYHYTIRPEENGFTVDSTEANLTFWTETRAAALRLIEMTDLASLAKKEGGLCTPLTG